MKKLSEEDMILKLSAKCSIAECCSYDLRQKLIRWEADKDTQDRIIKLLQSEKYVDDKRYTRAYINNKLTIDHWGRIKIEQALMRKHIYRDIFEPIFTEVDSFDQEETLKSLLASKYPTIKGKTEYNRVNKLIRFALQRGFTPTMIHKCLKDINLKDNDYYGD